MSHTHKGGFSLIEIVIAIALMALVLGIAVPVIIRQLNKGKKGTTETALRNTEQAIEALYADVSAFPNRLEDLVEKPTDEKLAKKWDGPYLKKVPQDGYGRELVYQLNAKGSKPPYELYSWGPDGEGSPKEEWISVWDL
jgi:general secretion pathway protein G